MKQHRMFWTLLVALMVASLVLAACGGGQATPAPAPTAAPAPTEVAPAPEPTKAPEAQPAEPTKAPETEPAETGGAMMGPDGRASYAGLDKDLTGQTIRMANIGGSPYETMYDQIKLFEEKTGAKVETVFLGDGFQIDRYLKDNYASGTVDFDVAWNHTSFMSQYTPFVEDLNQYFTPEELAAFSPAIIQAATIDGALAVDPAARRHQLVALPDGPVRGCGLAGEVRGEVRLSFGAAGDDCADEGYGRVLRGRGRGPVRDAVRRQGRGAGGPLLRAAGGQRRQLLRRQLRADLQLGSR